ncbi:MAG: DNA polymerase III subunit gamma/tau [Pseudomonadota bacterium]
MTDTLTPDGDRIADRPAYEVLARKYRPQNFDDLIGHGAMVRTLQNAFTAGRIAHAYILTGVRGVGKTTTARILARALNYQPKDGPDTGPQIEMAHEGLHCRAIAESRHPDVMEMDAASRTGVGDIRELIEGVRYAPIEARYKVYIIDEVHMLSTAAFNALLKTLEEPPPHVKFIFATTEIRKLPVTVLSRCQRFDLRRINPESLTAHLAAIAEKEAVSVEDEGLAIIARAAEGSVRDALSILDQAIVQQGIGEQATTIISAKTIQEMLGLADRRQSWDLLDACLEGKAEAALPAFRGQYDQGADPVVILRDLLELVHLVTRTKAAGPAAAAHGPAGAADADRATAMAEALSMSALTRAWSLMMKGLEETRLAPDPLAAGEMALIRLCYAADLPTPDEALRILTKDKPFDQDSVGGQNAPRDNHGAGTRAQASPPPRDKNQAPTGAPFRPVLVDDHPSADRAPEHTNPQSPEITSLADVAKLARHHRDSKLCAEIEAHVQVLHFAAPTIEVSLTDKAPADLLPRIMRALKSWTGETWTLTAPASADTDDKKLVDKTLRDQRWADTESHPMVKKALALFPGATIDKIREPNLGPGLHDGPDDPHMHEERENPSGDDANPATQGSEPAAPPENRKVQSS